MNSFEETDIFVGATILATDVSVVGGCERVSAHFATLSDAVILDWYIGDGERAEADDIVCKLVGPEHVLESGEEPALRILHSLSASTAASDATLFSMRYKID
jgi:nicotinate-nucleotide pyrophosphorylase